MEAEICPQVAHGSYARAMSTIRKAGDLVAAGLAPLERLPELERVAARYALAITPAMAELIDPADPHDPIARQFMPSGEELESGPLENADPIGDFTHSPVEGIVHRYPDRVLFLVTDRCASYCRYCTRSRLVSNARGYAFHPEFAEALSYIRSHEEVRDVLLSGKGSAAGNLDLRAARDLRGTAQAQWEVEGGVAAQAGLDLALAGALQSNGGIGLQAARHVAIDGALSAAAGIGVRPSSKRVMPVCGMRCELVPTERITKPAAPARMAADGPRLRTRDPGP